MSSGSPATRRQPSLTPKSKRSGNVKVTLTTLACGPRGVAKPGYVLDVPSEQAEQMITDRVARPHDKERDKHAKIGFQATPVDANQ